MSSQASRIGFYGGSFDPVTLGHFDIVTRAVALVDELVLGVGVHHGKKPLLAAQERVALLEAVCQPVADAANIKIRCVVFDGLAIDAARRYGAKVIIRGLRNAGDFDYEIAMGQMNAAMAGDIETVFLAASPSTRMIEASLVRQILSMGGDITSFVPAAVTRKLRP